VKVRGKTFRFITGHPEAFNPIINELQGLELLSGPAATSLPVVMAADFNSGPNAPAGFTGTYSNIIAAGFDDAWTALEPSLAGDTCCQLADLSNSSSDLFERIDQVFFNGGIAATSVERVGDDPINSTTPFWASDHDGLTAALQIPTE
jgi:endonuclease/exonuclease/phosphatase family metal-dependent hydrolase